MVQVRADHGMRSCYDGVDQGPGPEEGVRAEEVWATTPSAEQTGGPWDGMHQQWREQGT